MTVDDPLLSQTLQFDSATGAWIITPPAEEQLKTPERTAVLRVLKASPAPLTPTQVAAHLGKTPNATKKLLWRMAHEGDVITTQFGKYTTPAQIRNFRNFGNSSEEVNDQSSPGAAPEAVPPQTKSATANGSRNFSRPSNKQITYSESLDSPPSRLHSRRESIQTTNMRQICQKGSST